MKIGITIVRRHEPKLEIRGALVIQCPFFMKVGSSLAAARSTGRPNGSAS